MAVGLRRADEHAMPRVTPAGSAATPERRAPIDAATLGERLRAARIGHGLTLRQAADRSGLSRAFLSQVERGEVSPSVASLTKIAEALEIHLAELFLPPAQRTEGLVRAADRVRMTLRPGEHWDEVLSPSLHGKLLVLRSTILPGAGSGAPYHHPADEECVLVIEGRLDVEVDGVRYELAAGDALTYASRRLHGWENRTQEPVVALWIITPPNY
jgi:transcriptional regulator with XRE-family HTH domain